MYAAFANNDSSCLSRIEFWSVGSSMTSFNDLRPLTEAKDTHQRKKAHVWFTYARFFFESKKKHARKPKFQTFFAFNLFIYLFVVLCACFFQLHSFAHSVAEKFICICLIESKRMGEWWTVFFLFRFSLRLHFNWWHLSDLALLRFG